MCPRKLGTLDDLTQALGHVQSLFGTCLRQHSSEFFTTNTPENIDVAQGFLKKSSQFLQHEIARVMPVRIVDAFEVINVDHQQG